MGEPNRELCHLYFVGLSISHGLGSVGTQASLNMDSMAAYSKMIIIEIFLELKGLILENSYLRKALILIKSLFLESSS